MEQYNSTSLKHTSTNRSPAIDRAEEAVSHSVEKFEHAMQHLAERVEESRVRVESALDHVNRTRDEVFRIKESVLSSVEPFKPYVQSVGNVYTSARANPRPYLFGILGVVGALLAWTFYQGKKETEVFDTTLEVHPTYQ